jgi:hypothetical protein
MQGDWVADGTARGGGWTMHAHWWLTLMVAGGGVLKTSLKLYLKFVPQIVQKTPWKIGFAKGFFSQFEVRFEVRQILPQIATKNSCDRMGVRLINLKGMGFVLAGRCCWTKNQLDFILGPFFNKPIIRFLFVLIFLLTEQRWSENAVGGSWAGQICTFLAKTFV